MRWLSAVLFAWVVGCGGAANEVESPSDASKDVLPADASHVYEQLSSCAPRLSKAGITLQCQGFAIQLGQVEIQVDITDEVLRETESVAIGGVERAWGIPVERARVDLGGVPATGFPPPDAGHPGGLAVSTAVSASTVLITVCLGPPCPKLMGNAAPFFQALDRYLDDHPPAPAS